jgi:hypothetical protein
MGAKGNLGAIYAGRFIAGLGVGQTPLLAPSTWPRSLLLLFEDFAPASSPDSSTLALYLDTSPIMVAQYILESVLLHDG